MKKIEFLPKDDPYVHFEDMYRGTTCLRASQIRKVYSPVYEFDSFTGKRSPYVMAEIVKAFIVEVWTGPLFSDETRFYWSAGSTLWLADENREAYSRLVKYMDKFHEEVVMELKGEVEEHLWD